VPLEKQPRLHSAERRQHNFLKIRNFLCLILEFSLFNFEMNGADVVAEGCTQFPQLLVWERKGKPEIGTEVGNDVWDFCLMLSQYAPAPRLLRFKTRNDLQ